MKHLIFIILLFFQFSYSQIIKYEYNKIEKYEYDQKSNEFKFLKDSYEETKSTVIVDENEKMIIISQKFIPTNGEPQDTYEKYYFVKRELNGDDYKYFSVDLLNKKYIEFIINNQSTQIIEDCNAFIGCTKITTLIK